jgi:PLP dependent protein
MFSFSDRLAEIRETIARAAARSGRSPEAVALVAVTKTHGPEAVREALEAGHLLFGESRVQEARAKIPLLPARARWHFIGHLQRNKVRHALPLFELLHGVDSAPLVHDVHRTAEGLGLFVHLLLEVNVAGETSKFGFPPEQLGADLESLLALPRVQIDGLMAIPPPVGEPEQSRPFFVRLRELRDQLQADFGISLPHLSMGMSHDYAVAIEEGATLVRIGTALFGERSGPAWRPAAD